MSTTATSPYMDMRDPQLLLIVSGAATEFDYAANGKPTEFTATRQLARVLKKWLPGPVHGDDDGKVTQFDISTVGVVSRAVNPTTTLKVVDVVDQSWSMAEKLEHAEADTPRSDLANYRGFCVRLGRSLLSFRSSLGRYRPTNPYKR